MQVQVSTPHYLKAAGPSLLEASPITAKTLSFKPTIHS